MSYLDLHTRNGTCIDTRLRLTFAPDKIEKNASIKTSGRFIHIFSTTQKLKFSSYARELYEKRKNGSEPNGTERVPSGPDLSYGCRSSLLFIFAHKMNRRENQPSVLFSFAHRTQKKPNTLWPFARTTCLADKTNHPVESLSLNRSQCGSCSTKYDTSAGTKCPNLRFLSY